MFKRLSRGVVVVTRVIGAGAVLLLLLVGTSWSQPGGWQNPSNSLDTSGDGFFAPLDLLVVTNELILRSVSDPVTGALPKVASPPPFYDVNGDDFVAPQDLLILVNNLPRLKNLPGGGPISPPSPALVGSAANLRLVADSFGQESEGFLGITAVPEPNAILLILASVMFLAFRRR